MLLQEKARAASVLDVPEEPDVEVAAADQDHCQHFHEICLVLLVVILVARVIHLIIAIVIVLLRTATHRPTLLRFLSSQQSSARFAVLPFVLLPCP